MMDVVICASIVIPRFKVQKTIKPTSIIRGALVKSHLSRVPT